MLERVNRRSRNGKILCPNRRNEWFISKLDEMEKEQRNMK